MTISVLVFLAIVLGVLVWGRGRHSLVVSLLALLVGIYVGTSSIGTSVTAFFDHIPKMLGG